MKNTKEKSPVLPVIKYMLKIAKQERPILFFAYFLFFAVEIIRNATNILLPKLILDELFFIYNGEDVSVHLKKVVIFAAATVFSHFFANWTAVQFLHFRLVCSVSLYYKAKGK